MVVALVGLYAGCAREPAGGPSSGQAPSASAAKGAEVLARVGTSVVTAAEVQDVVAGTDLVAREAVEHLVEARVLAAEAARRGFGTHPEVLREAREAAVHALIARRVERDVTVRALPEARVAARCAEEIAARHEAAGEGAEPPTRAEVEPEVRRVLLLEARHEALARLLGELARRTPPQYDEDNVARALADDAVGAWTR